MKVIGQGRVVSMKAADEYCHEPDSHPDWQESVVLFAWDHEQKCYFFLRIGHEPNQGATGSAVIFSNIWAAGEYYRCCETLALTKEDRFENGCSAGSKLRYEYDGRHLWSVRDGAVSADLVMDDSYMPPFNFFPAGHNLDEVAPHHIEAAGSVSGSISLNGRVFQIKNAIGHRDRSWGVRKWETIRGHRWGPAIFDQDFMAHALAMQAPDGSLTQFGYVYRDGVFHIPEQVSIVSFVEADGLTTRGGIVNFVMESGERLEFTYRNIVPGSLSFHRGYLCNDAPCKVICGERVGSGLLEYGNNAAGNAADGVVKKPRQTALLGSHVDDGIFPYQHGDSLTKS